MTAVTRRVAPLERCSRGCRARRRRRGSARRATTSTFPNKATPGRRQGDGRGREAARAGPGAHLLRRRLDPPGDVGGEALPVRRARTARRSCRMTRSCRPGSSFEARHEDGLRRWRAPRRSRPRSRSEQAGFKVKTHATRERSSKRSRPTRPQRRSSTRATSSWRREASRSSRPGQLRAAVQRRPSRRRRRAPGPPRRPAQDRDGTHGRVAAARRAGRSSGSASPRRPTSSCRSRSTSTSARSAARRPGFRSRSTCSRSSARTSTRAAGRRDGRDRARRHRRPDRRRQAEDVRRTRGRRGCLPRAGWGKRSRGTPLCREPSHHPGGEFSTGVVRSAYASLEIANLQAFSPHADNSR